MADRVGLCSVTLREFAPEDVLSTAAAAGLRCIEWGADVHAPPSDGGLDELRRDTAAHGLRICSYGSYWRAGTSSLDEFGAVASAAESLGTSRIRVWAGSAGTVDTSAAGWREVVIATQHAAVIAGDHGCGLAFEFHGGTLTDTVEGTLRLLDDVDHANVSTYWQPPLDAADDEAIAGLERLVERVSAVHVFSWWPGATRLRLAGRQSLWRRVVHVLDRHQSTADLLLEFVPDDDPTLLAGEAAFLRSLTEVWHR